MCQWIYLNTFSRQIERKESIELKSTVTVVYEKQVFLKLGSHTLNPGYDISFCFVVFKCNSHFHYKRNIKYVTSLVFSIPILQKLIKMCISVPLINIFEISRSGAAEPAAAMVETKVSLRLEN